MATQSPPPQTTSTQSPPPPSTSTTGSASAAPRAPSQKHETTQPQSYKVEPGSSKDVPWYNPADPRLTPPIVNLLRDYAHIPPEQQVAHVVAVREKAYAIHPYPCLGLYAFLRLHLQTSPLFGQIVEDLKTDPKALFVDIGTGLGQEIRSLIAAGVPVEKLRGVELEPEFNDLGCELFGDSASVKQAMLVGDILKDNGSGSLEDLYGKVSVLHAASFLHLWDWDGQIDVASRMVRLMQDRVGVIMVGRQIGSAVAKAKVHETNKNGQTMWKHDPESFVRLWDAVGEKTGTKWDVKAELGKPYVVKDERTGEYWHDPDTRTIIWSLVRTQ